MGDSDKTGVGVSPGIIKLHLDSELYFQQIYIYISKLHLDSVQYISNIFTCIAMIFAFVIREIYVDNIIFKLFSLQTLPVFEVKRKNPPCIV